MAVADDRGDTVLAKRDRLLDYLEKIGVPGVYGAGLTRVDKVEHLLLLVGPGYERAIPQRFEGIPVIVRLSDRAKA